MNAVYRFPAEVRLGNAPQVLAEASAQGGAQRVFDLAGCRSFDSSLIAVLLELLRRSGVESAQCRFEAPSANLVKLSLLYGVGPLLFPQALPTAVANGSASSLAAGAST